MVKKEHDYAAIFWAESLLRLGKDKRYHLLVNLAKKTHDVEFSDKLLLNFPKFDHFMTDDNLPFFLKIIEAIKRDAEPLFSYCLPKLVPIITRENFSEFVGPLIQVAKKVKGREWIYDYWIPVFKKCITKENLVKCVELMVRLDKETDWPSHKRADMAMAYRRYVKVGGRYFEDGAERFKWETHELLGLVLKRLRPVLTSENIGPVCSELIKIIKKAQDDRKFFNNVVLARFTGIDSQAKMRQAIDEVLGDHRFIKHDSFLLKGKLVYGMD